MRQLGFVAAAVCVLLSASTTLFSADSWRGQWIWYPGEPSPKNFYLYARKTFEVAGEVTSATIRMSADSRYIAYVNEVLVGRGPIRSDPRWQSYDVWDIRPQLRPGRNVLAVLVHHIGEGTLSYIKGRGGLIVDGTVKLGDGSGVDIVSDDSWKVYPSEAWRRDIPRMSERLGFSEVFDARREPATWKTVGFDDSYWTSAEIIGPHPQDPWSRLVMREIPAATEEQVFPEKILSTHNVIADKFDHPALGMSQAEILPRHKGDLINIDNMLKPEEQARILAPGDTGISLILDFGREVVGYPQLDIALAREGTQIDIGYSEALTEEGYVDPYASKVMYADRYICRDGPQVFRTFDKRAFRYMRLDIYDTKDYLRLTSVRLNLSTYPVDRRGTFSSSDDILDAIWRTGAYTLLLNMEDVYTDSPWCDRAMWCGDARIGMICGYYAFGDVALGRRGMRLIGQSQREDGRVRGVYPTEFQEVSAPDHMLIWVMSIWDDYIWTGDDSIIRELYPKVVRLLDWFAGHVNKNHLLADVPGDVFIDHVDIDTDGECAALNAFYYRALRDAAEMAQLMGDLAKQKDLEKRVDRLRKAFNKRFWDKDLKVFRDARKGDQLSPVISQQTNALAVLFDLAPEKNVRDILSFILDPQNESVRRVSPYFSFYLLGALATGGRYAEMYQYIRDRWGKMLESGATTWWDSWDQPSSYCRTSSSAPTYFLPALLAGIQPTSPGWKTAMLEPNLPGIERVSVTVPTPLGEIAATVTHRTGGYIMGVELTCPTGCEVTVSFPLDEVVKPRVLFDGEKQVPRNVIPEGEHDGRLLYRVIGPAHLLLGLQSVPR